VHFAIFSWNSLTWKYCRCSVSSAARTRHTGAPGTSPSLNEEGGIVADRVRNEIDQIGTLSLMSITPRAIQDLFDELEASKQSRLRAWNVLQRLRLVLSEAGNVTIPPPAQKSFDAEGGALEHALTKSFRLRNDAIKSLCSSVRRSRDATIKEECKSDYPYALRRFGKRWIGQRIS
jgi:hypothetical protein